ncbi:MAG: DUF839 domain-containing protein [Gammaproteobacteria bacterium]|nr:DUF839 domain-containing protein [Gammaproteobacteria bacterium]
MVSRRQFIVGSAGVAFAGLGYSLLGNNAASRNAINLSEVHGYGALKPDPNGLLDLPEGFSYQVISERDDTMTDGLPVPDRADGMGCFKLDDDRVALVRNHEIHPKHLDDCQPAFKNLKSELAYDQFNDGVALPGGTTNLVYNTKTQNVEQEYLTLIGTVRNCSGGITPWGTWLTCEESVLRAGDDIQNDHGYVFEIPANAKGLVNPEPLKAMGRFNHEAAVVDPRTGIVYLTEDKDDSLFYRFIPNVKGQLNQGGKLQALVIKGHRQLDTRNWDRQHIDLQSWYEVEWLNLANPEAPEDDLRLRGYQQGAALFARGEGIHMGDNEMYFCCTSGGHAQFGQVMRYQPSAFEGQTQEQSAPGQIQLFLESTDASLYNFGDNLTVMPNGHLMVCEDQYLPQVDNYLRGVTPDGKVYPFAQVKIQTEPAGACFSPDGQVMFVNLYSPTKTLAITGPWQDFKA